MTDRYNQNCNIDLDAWLKQPSGSYIHAWEQRLLDQLTADIFGFNAVQIGLPQMNCLAASRMPNRWLANNVLMPNSPNKIALLHDFEDLPFETQSLDLVVLPHVLAPGLGKVAEMADDGVLAQNRVLGLADVVGVDQRHSGCEEHGDDEKGGHGVSPAFVRCFSRSIVTVA